MIPKVVLGRGEFHVLLVEWNDMPALVFDRTGKAIDMVEGEEILLDDSLPDSILIAFASVEGVSALRRILGDVAKCLAVAEN